MQECHSNFAPSLFAMICSTNYLRTHADTHKHNSHKSVQVVAQRGSSGDKYSSAELERILTRYEDVPT